MYINKISLQNFRKFSSYQLEFDEKTTLLIGKNGSGKTSIIEALNLLATGVSLRAGKVEEMILLGEDLGRIKGVIKSSQIEDGGYSSDDSGELNLVDDLTNNTELEIILTRGIVQGKKTAKRLYTRDGAKKRKKDVIGEFSCVVFRPEDMRLIEGSPGRRRNFIDNILSNVSRDYAHALHTYTQALKRRNKLLEQIREGGMNRNVLDFWDRQLVKHGEYIQQNRRKFYDFCNLQQHQLKFQVVAKESLMTEKRMSQYLDRSIAAGFTLIGPHKDDFDIDFWVDGEVELQSLSDYGSRGQQRLGVLWLKICELIFLEKQNEQKPLLLLDDIFSELDDQSRKIVLNLLDQQQTIITSADDDIQKFVKNTQVVSLF